MPMLSILLAVLGAFAAPAPPDLPFVDLAERFEERHGLACDPCDVQELLDRNYVRLALGSFDLRYPADALADEREVERFAAIAAALVDLQSGWQELLGADGEASREAEKLAPLVRKWLADWPASAFAQGLAAESRDALALAGGSEKERLGVARYDELAHGGASLGLDLAARPRSLVVFSPTREDLVGLVCFIGANDAPNRGAFWTDGVLSWTDFWWFDAQFVALEYPPAAATPERFAPGIDMNEREPTGLLQHVVQRSAYALAGRLYGEALDPALMSGLAQNLVVRQFGENNTRSGGSTKGNSTRARSVFIPGGNPNGGMLPPDDADSSWRADRGAGYFVEALRAAQLAGSKSLERGEDKLSAFALANDAGSETTAVRAPFLGRAAEAKPMPPEPFQSDYREFFRAYKSAFAHWLATAAAGSARKSSEAFADLLVRAAAEGADFEALVAEIYAAPLSGPAGEDALEWRFLAWLAKR